MAASGDWQWPLVGMLAFSTVFALPFFVLALVPQWMASLPQVRRLAQLGEGDDGLPRGRRRDEVPLERRSRLGLGHLHARRRARPRGSSIFVLMAIYVLGLFRFAHDAPGEARRHRRLATSLLRAARSACGSLTRPAGKPLGELEAFLPPPPESMRSRRGDGPASASCRGS